METAFDIDMDEYNTRQLSQLNEVVDSNKKNNENFTIPF